MSVLPGSRSGLSRPLLLGIFFIAMAMLLLEVVLTRIFSVTMYYHFAFMVVSITLFGMGVPGIFCLPAAADLRAGKERPACDHRGYALRAVGADLPFPAALDPFRSRQPHGVVVLG
jgi:hypothetical protein